MSGTAIIQRMSDGRDVYVDFVRAVSLLVVVVWHWVFTMIIWRDDGPHATNPIGFTTGLWLLTWLFQVMPLFFYVGGFAHLTSWERAEQRNERIGRFVWRRLRQLAAPGLALLVAWVVIGIVLTFVFDWAWIRRAVQLVVSPLWFLAVYLMLIALLPAALWLHRRFDTAVLVVAAGIAGAVDIARFRHGWAWTGWINMVVVWGLCHQLGFFYGRLTQARRSVDWTLMLGGLLGLGGLVFSGLYPGSMVGVPGERSNMAPPTLCIVALVLFQAGLVELIRPAVVRRLARPAWSATTAVINRFALPLFLFHSTGMAVSQVIAYGFGREIFTNEPTIGWWLYRPLAMVGPLLCTLPVIYLFGRRWSRGSVAAQRAITEPST